MNDLNLTPEQEEAVYRKVKMQYLTEDAKAQVENYCVCIEDRNDPVDVAILTILNNLNEEDFKIMAEDFSNNHDCSLSDDAQWENIINKWIK